VSQIEEALQLLVENFVPSWLFMQANRLLPSRFPSLWSLLILRLHLLLQCTRRSSYLAFHKPISIRRSLEEYDREGQFASPQFSAVTMLVTGETIVMHSLNSVL
jgi:hypothetical protein